MVDKKEVSKTAIILALSALCITSIIYNINFNIRQYRDLKDHHKRVVDSIMNVVIPVYEEFKATDLEKSMSVDEQADFESLIYGFLYTLLLIGADSIVSVFDELSEEQRQIIGEINQVCFGQFMKLVSETDE